MIMRIIKLGLLLMIINILGCQSQLASKAEAGKIAEQFLSAVNTGNYDEAFKYASEDFFKFRTKETWIEYYDAVIKELGPILSVKQYNMVEDDRYSGTFFIFQYSVKHEKGSTKEMITLVQPVIDDHGVKIVAHKIDSRQLSEIDKRF